MMDSGVTAAPPRRVEYSYLDGMRGIAALAVVVFHAFLFTGASGEAAERLPVVGWLIGYGYLGVPVFIVLSGYVLMLPLTQSATLSFRRGIGDYVRRRAKRILPPYYAALFLTLGLIALVPVLQQPSGTAWDSKIPVTLDGVLAHLLLIHDLSPDWAFLINGPLWSVAVEWQIYFLMPFVLLPLWRRMSPWVLIPVVLAVTLGASLLGFAPWAHLWLIGLFACGMFAAQLTTSPHVRRSLVTFLTVLSVGLTTGLLLLSPFLQEKIWLSEIVAGLAFAALLVLLGRRSNDGTSIGAFAVFRSRSLRYAGLISYSVYLVHSPLLALGNILLLGLALPLWAHYTAMMVLVVPITLLVCWGFFLLVERRFQNTHQASVTSTIREPRVRRGSIAAPRPR